MVVLRKITLGTLVPENVARLRECFIASARETEAQGAYAVTAVEVALLMPRLVTAAELLMLRESILLSDLPEMRAVILRFLPDSFHERIARCLREYLAENDGLNLEGFVRFRLRELSAQLEQMVLRLIVSAVIGRMDGESEDWR